MTDAALSNAELISMRNTVSSYLAGTAIIYVSTNTSDSQGGFGTAFAASGTVSARLSPLSGAEAEVASRIAEQNVYVLTLPNATAIDADDRVEYNSVTYEVVEVRTRVPWELSRRVIVVEVN